MWTKSIPEPPAKLHILTQLPTREYFIEFCRRERLGSRAIGGSCLRVEEDSPVRTGGSVLVWQTCHLCFIQWTVPYKVGMRDCPCLTSQHRHPVTVSGFRKHRLLELSRPCIILLSIEPQPPPAGLDRLKLAIMMCNSDVSTVQYSTVQYGTVQYSTVQYGTVQHSKAQHSTVQHSTTHYSTVKYSTAQ